MQKIPWIAAASLALVGATGGCGRASDDVQPPPVEVVAESTCGADSMLRTELYGSIERSLSWSAADMHCESMLRPDGEGVRLRFTGDAAERQLAIILALPGLEPGATGKELPTVATLTVEGTGRFFNTPNLDSCWSDITANDAVATGDGHYDVMGTLYCVAPLGEVNGDAAISIPELEFRGIVEWGAQ